MDSKLNAAKMSILTFLGGKSDNLRCRRLLSPKLDLVDRFGTRRICN